MVVNVASADRLNTSLNRTSPKMLVRLAVTVVAAAALVAGEVELNRHGAGRQVVRSLGLQ
jgi:hypothetical protein